MDILRSMKFFLLWISLMDVKAHCLPTALAGNPTPWTRWPQRNCWVFYPPFQTFFLLRPELYCVNIKDFMVLFKREPSLSSLKAVCFASGIKDSRNWPQNGTPPQHWWEFALPCPCHFTCHVLPGCPCSTTKNKTEQPWQKNV